MVQFSNAKINIGLFVTNKREDGYHDLESLFVPIDLKDAVELVPAEFNDISIYNKDIPGVKKTNSCLKALELMQNKYNVGRYHIHLLKNVPTGAGLGGGSSNATTTLKIINQLENLNLSTTQLENLALLIGSDNPFFVENTAKYVTGRGEVMNECHLNLKGYNVFLIYPQIHMSTKTAYQNITLSKPEINLQNATNEDLFLNPEQFKNSFQQVFINEYPETQLIVEQLNKSGADYVSLSGSGSSFFGIYRNAPTKQQLEPLESFCQENGYEFYKTNIL